jgi:hypothetical protein
MLEIVLGQTETKRPPTVLADTPGSISAEAAKALTSSSVSCRRLLFAAPPLGSTAESVRRWHRDLWNGLDASDRRRVVLVAGETAQYLAPLLGEETRVFAFVDDPVESALHVGFRLRMLEQLEAAARDGGQVPRSIGPLVNAQSRALLGPWHDFAGLSVSQGPPPNATEWRTALLEDVLERRVTAFPAEAVADETAKIANSLRWNGKTVARYLEGGDGRESRKISPEDRTQIEEFCWLDAELRGAVTASPASR